MAYLFGSFNFHSGFSDTESKDVQILRSLEGGYLSYIFGELFLPSGDLLTQKNFESDFLPAFRKDANKFLTNCEGSFIFALYDKQQRELHLVTDPFGNLALHYHQHRETLYFSTQSKRIADALAVTEKDKNAVLEYLAFGYPLNGKTFYKEIHRLGVASHLRFSDRGLFIERFFTPSFEVRSKSEYPEILRQIKELIVHNVDIRTREENVRSGLSGGFDSRVILAALSYLGRKNVELFTLGLPDSSDIRLAKRLGSVAGFRHIFFTFDDQFLSELPRFMEQTVILSEGGLGIESSPQLAVWEKASEESIRHLDGHGGAIYRRQIPRVGIPKTKRTSLIAQYAFAKMNSSLLRSDILNTEIKNEAEKQTLRSLHEYIETLPQHLTGGDKMDRFYIEQKCAHRYSLAGNLEMNYTHLSHPLLSARIWELISQLDDSFRGTNAVHRYLIHSLSPSLERIPLDNSGFRVPYKGYNYLRYVPQILDRYIIKNISKLSPTIGKSLSLQHLPYSLAMVVAAGPDKIREIALSESPGFDHYFIKSAIEKLDVYDPRIAAVANAKILLGSLRGD